MAEDLAGGAPGSEEGKPEAEGPGSLRQAGSNSYLDPTGRALIAIGCPASSERTHRRAASGERFPELARRDEISGGNAMSFLSAF